MSSRVRKNCLLLLCLVFMISFAALFGSLCGYWQGRRLYQEAVTLARVPDFCAFSITESIRKPEHECIDPYAEALQTMDFAALREVNSEVLGWLLVPNTGISYPLLRHSDNQYYLGHSWNKTRSPAGAIFLDCAVDKELGDFNSIIYGHRMNDCSMFAPLLKYKEQSFWAAHPCIYLADDSGSRRYDIFAAYEVSTDGLTYATAFADTQSLQKYIDYCLQKSVLDTGLQPTVEDKLLTLSTCTGNGHTARWVVQAVYWYCEEN